MRKHNFYEGMIPMPEDFTALQENAEAAVRESSVALSGAGVLEGLELRLDGAAKNLSVTAGKGLRVDGQLLQLGAAQDLKLPSDGKAYAVVLRYQSAETQERATTLQGEDTWTEKQDETSALVVEWTQSKDKQHRQADDLVLGTLQNGALDLGKREVAQGWQAVKTQAQDLQGFKGSTAQNFDKAEQALKQSRAALGGKGVLEGLELKLDATAKTLSVTAGKALRADGQLLQLGAAQDLKLPSDNRGYGVVLRHEAQSGSTKAQLEYSPQADDLVLGQLLRDPKDNSKHVLDLLKREVARGWPSLTSAPFGVKSPLLTLNAGEDSSSISTPSPNVPHIQRSKTPYTAPFSARNSHQCAVFAPKGNSAPRLWLIGGYNQNGATNDVWSTVDGIRWKKHSGAPFAPRRIHQVVAFQNKLWVLGGDTGGGGVSSESWYSEDGESWKQWSGSNFRSRWGHQAVVFKAKGDSAEKLWLIGGSYGTRLNDVWSFDGNSWTNHGNANFTARYSHQVVAFGGRLWLIGGQTNNSVHNNDVLWSEDGVSWSRPYTAAFSPRYAHQALIYDSKMWIMGGYIKNGIVNDVWSTQDGIHWQGKAWSAAFSPRGDHEALVFNKRMWVIGGAGNNGYVADVWSSTDGVDWRNYAVEEQRVTKEKRVAGLRVERGSAGQSVLAYAEESGQWEIDGRGIATNEAEVQDALSLNKAKLDALRAQLLGEINKAKHEWCPIGTIIAFSGKQWVDNQTLPGWYQCNGKNNTPDLRDRFIKGKTDPENTGDGGGANSQRLSANQLPAHKHDATGLSASCATAGSHRHYNGAVYEDSTAAKYGYSNNTFFDIHLIDIWIPSVQKRAYEYVTSYAGSHSHSISLSGSTADTGGGQALDMRPAFYSVIYIMRVQ